MTSTIGLSLVLLSSSMVVSCGSRPRATGNVPDAADPVGPADGGADSGDGEVPVPPFSIPTATGTGTLRPCGTLADPSPLALLADGRALVAQYTALPDSKESNFNNIVFVRAWTPQTGALDELFVGAGRIVPSENGGRLFELKDGGFRVFDVLDRRFLTDEKVAVQVERVSGDGNFVIDQTLRRYTAMGEQSFDFGALIPPGSARVPFALSYTGDSLVVSLGSREDPKVPFRLVVVRDNGESFLLSDSSGLDYECGIGRCALRWSRDGQFILAQGRSSVRVWHVATRELRHDDAAATLRAATFSPTDQALLLVDGNDGSLFETPFGATQGYRWGSVEQDRLWSSDFEAPLAVMDQSGRRVLFWGSRAAGEREGLLVAGRAGVEGRWNASSLGQYFSFATTAEAVFATFDQLDVPRQGVYPVVSQGLARWPSQGGPATHEFRTTEFQTEFHGQVVLTPDEKRVAVVFPDSVRVLDASNLALLATVPSPAGMIAWSPDTRTLALTPDVHYRDPGRLAYVPRAEIALWSAIDGRAVTNIPLPVVPMQVAFDEAGHKLVGWGYPQVATNTEDDGLVQISPFGEKTTFEVDLATRQVTPGRLPVFVASTRELVATETEILKISTGETVARLSTPALESGVFSSDWSVLLGVGSDSTLRMVATGDGHAIAAVPAIPFSPLRLASSRDGRRAAVGYESIHTYCLQQ